MSAPAPTEPTPAGEQRLLGGIKPIAGPDRLRLRSQAPLTSTRAQKPCDCGLFDLAGRNQLALFSPEYRP